MIALLKANLKSFSRSKILLKCLLAEGLYILLMFVMDVWLSNCYVKDLPADRYAFFAMDFINIFTAIIICSIAGTDFHNGTIRNKLIAGYSRTQVYLAGFMTSAVLAVFNYLLVTAFGILMVYPFFGAPNVALEVHVPMLLFCVLSIIAAAAVYYLICMMVHSKNSATVLCLITGFLAILMSSACSESAYDTFLLPDSYTLRELPAYVRRIQLWGHDDAQIEQTEWYQEAIESGEIDLDAVIQNDANLAEPMRKFYLLCMDAVPTVQINNAIDGVLFSEYHYCIFPYTNHVVLLAFIDLFEIILLNGIGCLAFRRMKLK